MQRTKLAEKEVDWEAERKRFRAHVKAFVKKHKLKERPFRILSPEERDELSMRLYETRSE